MRKPLEQQVNILRCVRERDIVSRPDLCSALGLSHATVSSRVGELIGLGLLVEEGFEASTGGRPRARVRLNGGHMRMSWGCTSAHAASARQRWTFEGRS